MSELVRAAVLEEPGKFAVRAFPRPHIEEDALLLRIEMVGLCGSDRHMYLGHSNMEWPALPGHELVGVVEEIGPLANSTMIVMGGPIEVGDQVVVVPSSKPCYKCFYCRQAPGRPNLCPNRVVYGFRNCATPPYLVGGYAEYMYVSGNSWVYKVNDMPAELAFLADPAATATRAVDRAFGTMPNLGESYGLARSVVVQGAGPIGLLTIANLAFTGADPIIAIDSVPARLEIAKGMGATEVLDLRTKDRAQRLQRVRELTEGVGADVVIEAAGVPVAFAEALDLVRRGGKVIEVGHYTDPGAVEIHPFTVCNKDVEILGSWAYPQIQFKEALNFLKRCDKPLRSLVTHTLNLDEVEKGMQLCESPDTVKVVFQP